MTSQWSRQAKHIDRRNRVIDGSQGHISTVNANSIGGTNVEPIYEPDGLCHCDTPIGPSPIGECGRCFRLVLT